MLADILHLFSEFESTDVLFCVNDMVEYRNIYAPSRLKVSNSESMSFIRAKLDGYATQRKINTDRGKDFRKSKGDVDEAVVLEWIEFEVESKEMGGIVYENGVPVANMRDKKPHEKDSLRKQLMEKHGGTLIWTITQSTNGSLTTVRNPQSTVSHGRHCQRNSCLETRCHWATC